MVLKVRDLGGREREGGRILNRSLKVLTLQGGVESMFIIIRRESET